MLFKVNHMAQGQPCGSRSNMWFKADYVIKVKINLGRTCVILLTIITNTFLRTLSHAACSMKLGISESER
jgi:hypothetical protein